MISKEQRLKAERALIRRFNAGINGYGHRLVKNGRMECGATLTFRCTDLESLSWIEYEIGSTGRLVVTAEHDGMAEYVAESDAAAAGRIDRMTAEADGYERAHDAAMAAELAADETRMIERARTMVAEKMAAGANLVEIDCSLRAEFPAAVAAKVAAEAVAEAADGAAELAAVVTIAARHATDSEIAAARVAEADELARCATFAESVSDAAGRYAAELFSYADKLETVGRANVAAGFGQLGDTFADLAARIRSETFRAGFVSAIRADKATSAAQLVGRVMMARTAFADAPEPGSLCPVEWAEAADGRARCALLAAWLRDGVTGRRGAAMRLDLAFIVETVDSSNEPTLAELAARLDAVRNRPARGSDEFEAAEAVAELAWPAGRSWAKSRAEIWAADKAEAERKAHNAANQLAHFRG